MEEVSETARNTRSPEAAYISHSVLEPKGNSRWISIQRVSSALVTHIPGCERATGT